jgi:NAD(P)H dehydrogenase (quinone)
MEKVKISLSNLINVFDSGGGNEMTILNILEAMLIHGMIIPGAYSGDHYGPVAINEPDARVKKQCLALGSRIAKLAEKLTS